MFVFIPKPYVSCVYSPFKRQHWFWWCPDFLQGWKGGLGLPGLALEAVWLSVLPSDSLTPPNCSNAFFAGGVSQSFLVCHTQVVHRWFTSWSAGTLAYMKSSEMSYATSLKSCFINLRNTSRKSSERSWRLVSGTWRLKWSLRVVSHFLWNQGWSLKFLIVCNAQQCMKEWNKLTLYS